VTATSDTTVQPGKITASSPARDSVTKKMGDYLLKGWTMLQDSCPQCAVPLMKKDDNTICVSCGASIIRPEEYDPSKHRIMNTSAKPEIETTPQKELPKQEIPTKPQQETPKPSSSHSQIVENTLNVLYSKLDETQNLLRSASVEDTKNLLLIISEITKTILTVKQL
jgi:uncharacterized Zn finger protein (UPF0148 family)